MHIHIHLGNRIIELRIDTQRDALQREDLKISLSAMASVQSKCFAFDFCFIFLRSISVLSIGGYHRNTSNRQTQVNNCVQCYSR